MPKYPLQKHKTHKKHNVLVVKKQVEPPFIDRMTFVAAIVEPIITLPQAEIIFREQTAAGVSLFSWVGFQLMTAIWILYAVKHKEKLIFIYQGLFFLVQTAVIVGGIMYGANWW